MSEEITFSRRRRRMGSHRFLRRVVTVASATAVVLVVSLSAAASPPVDVPQNSVWHRLDMDHANAAPEQERLSCSRGFTWTCHYDKVPEPVLNFWWDTTSGDFVGTDVKQTWTCPVWFPTSVCENVTMVVAGTMSITRADGISFSGPFDLVLARAGSDALVLHAYWPVFGFTCPWYRTFSDSLAANPMPLPFNGVDWPPLDCSFAP
jgi:hypothetical protein